MQHQEETWRNWL